MTPKKKNDAKLSALELSALELAVMNIIWTLGESGSREIIDAYNAVSARKLADTTIRTVIANLRRKGYLTPVATIERGMRVRPAIAREPVARRSFGQLIAQFFGGSPSQAIAYLIKNEAIDEAEIKQLRRLIDGLGKGKKER